MTVKLQQLLNLTHCEDFSNNVQSSHTLGKFRSDLPKATSRIEYGTSLKQSTGLIHFQLRTLKNTFTPYGTSEASCALPGFRG
jgi:hypothetical protein